MASHKEQSLKEQSLVDVLDHPADKIALQDSQQTIYYGQLREAVLQRSKDLVDVSVVGLAMDNSVEWVLWDLAAQQCNIVCVPLPPFFSAEQIAHTIQSAGVTHIRKAGTLHPTGINAIHAIPEKTAKITYTSGTTSEPKGVCLSQQAMTQVATSIVDVLGSDLVGHHHCVLPFSVLLENVAGVYAALIAGCTIHVTPIEQFGKHYGHLHAYLKKSRASSIILVPEILRSLMQQVLVNGSLPDLRFVAVGGSKINPDVLVKAQSLGLPVFEGYGLSECASVVSLNTPTNQRVGSVGQLLPHVNARIIEGEMTIIDSGFLGYLGEAAPSLFPTGDIGEVDEEGYLTITGRKKNILITSYGRNIAAEWIESLILLYPDVFQTMVFGDAESHLSAFIVPTTAADKANSVVAAVIEKVNRQLPEYAHIQQTYIVEPFTVENKQLTGTGRPRRHAILAHYLHSLSPPLQPLRTDSSLM